MENWTSLRISCGSRGQVAVEGQLQDADADNGVTLSFEPPDVGHSYLSGWIEQL